MRDAHPNLAGAGARQVAGPSKMRWPAPGRAVAIGAPVESAAVEIWKPAIRALPRGIRAERDPQASVSLPFELRLPARDDLVRVTAVEVAPPGIRALAALVAQLDVLDRTEVSGGHPCEDAPRRYVA